MDGNWPIPTAKRLKWTSTSKLEGETKTNSHSVSTWVYAPKEGKAPLDTTPAVGSKCPFPQPHSGKRGLDVCDERLDKLRSANILDQALAEKLFAERLVAEQELKTVTNVKDAKLAQAKCNALRKQALALVQQIAERESDEPRLVELREDLSGKASQASDDDDDEDGYPASAECFDDNHGPAAYVDEWNEGGEPAKFVSQDSFAELGVLMPFTVQSLHDNGLEYVSTVQKFAIPAIANGAPNILLLSRTGTGKTLSYLIPLVDKVMNSDWNSEVDGIYSVVLSQSREAMVQVRSTACQIASCYPRIALIKSMYERQLQEKRKAMYYEYVVEAHTDVGILCTTSRSLAKYMLNARKFVLFDGRFQKRMRRVKVVVFDELSCSELEYMRGEKQKAPCSQLLWRVWRQRGERQVVVISAVDTKLLRTFVRSIFHMGSEVEVNCLGSREEQSMPHVKQSYVVARANEMLHELTLLIDQARTDHRDNYKVVVLFNSHLLQQVVGAVFEEALGDEHNMWSITQKGKPDQRDVKFTQFRESSTGVLFGTLITDGSYLRGMSVPDITHVFHFGAPTKGRFAYLHSIGLTGRGGAIGTSVLLVQQFEHWLVNTHIAPYYPIVRQSKLSQRGSAMSAYDFSPHLEKIPPLTRGVVYKALLEQYVKLYGIKHSFVPPSVFVAAANELSTSVLGCKSVPRLKESLVRKMQLNTEPDIRIIKPLPGRRKKRGTRTVQAE